MSKRIDSFQYLRCLCAMAVFVSHLPYFSKMNEMNGQAGVALFMIMSGFFIMFSSEREKNNILLKKIIKIVPLYWTLTLLLFLVAILKPTLLNYTEASGIQLVKSLFFIPFYVAGSGHKPIINVGWYLDIEMAFVLLFAIISKINFHRRGVYTGTILLGLFFLGRLLPSSNFFFEVYTSFYVIYYFVGILFYYIYIYI